MSNDNFAETARELINQSLAQEAHNDACADVLANHANKIAGAVVKKLLRDSKVLVTQNTALLRLLRGHLAALPEKREVSLALATIAGGVAAGDPSGQMKAHDIAAFAREIHQEL